ncbi:MAG TPA: TetR/AcrR family transcriptional regulator C-terminal domain-containing protein [Roseiarcus sp.]|nr:TetR/AcrR family transcriptional regulator C-terminal domain-containing protein [Roseiarcus sp.]
MPGASIEERLEAVAAVILTRALVPETVGLARVAVAEARRFPHVATRVSRMARERNTETISRLLTEFAESDRTRSLPALAPDRMPDTARRFLDLVVLPMLYAPCSARIWPPLRAEIGPHAARTVAFFLAACSCGGEGC